MRTIHYYVTDVENGTRICCTCKVEKPLEDFPESNHQPLGRHYFCKACAPFQADNVERRKKGLPPMSSIGVLNQGDFTKTGRHPINTIRVRSTGQTSGGGMIHEKRKVIKTEKGWVNHARYVMKQHLGLEELPERHQVHHIDGDTLNDAIENLELLSGADHKWMTEKQVKDPMHYTQILKQLENYWTMWTMYREARDRGWKIPVGLLSYERGGDLS